MEDYSSRNIEELKARFKRFAEGECKEVSPMYYFLANKVAEDTELIDIAKKCIQGQPMPNLFFASIQYLLFKNPNALLSKQYPVP